MARNWLNWTLALMMAAGLAACGKSEDKKNEEKQQVEQDEAQKLVSEHNSLASEINSERPSDYTPEEELKQLEAKLDRLEALGHEIRRRNGTYGLTITGGENDQAIALKRAAIRIARDKRFERVEREEKQAQISNLTKTLIANSAILKAKGTKKRIEMTDKELADHIQLLNQHRNVLDQLIALHKSVNTYFSNEELARHNDLRETIAKDLRLTNAVAMMSIVQRNRLIGAAEKMDKLDKGIAALVTLNKPIVRANAESALPLIAELVDLIKAYTDLYFLKDSTETDERRAFALLTGRKAELENLANNIKAELAKGGSTITLH